MGEQPIETQLALMNARLESIDKKLGDSITENRESRQDHEKRIRDIEATLISVTTRLTIFSVGTASLSIIASAIAAAIMYALTR